eukprot:1464519-Rhodomonas_salina.1
MACSLSGYLAPALGITTSDKPAGAPTWSCAPYGEPPTWASAQYVVAPDVVWFDVTGKRGQVLVGDLGWCLRAVE